MKSVLKQLCAVGLGLAFAATSTLAGPFDSLNLKWNWCPDPTNDAAPFAGSQFEAYGIGVAFTETHVYIQVATHLHPNSTPSGHDSYGTNNFSPGDLYLNVGGMFQDGTGTSYGIGTTDHVNVVPQAYGGVWDPVVRGNLYTGTQWADGTYETYQQDITTELPDDGDGDDGKNSYPTLIRAYAQEVVGVSTFEGEFLGAASVPRWNYWYSVERSAIGLTNADTLQVFWTMECGNDGAEWKGDVPEPTTVALLSAGVAAMARRRRNRNA